VNLKFYLTFIIFVLSSISCSHEQFNRTVYESLNNIKQNRCQQDFPIKDFPKDESYNDYLRKVKENNLK